MKALIGNSKGMVHVHHTIERLAPEPGPVLITGETGSGKELAARLFHHGSGRKKDRFFVVDCTNLTMTLAESLLFGHRKGAFTGATEDRDGIFKVAHEGTVFIDEIGDLHRELQSKLLRVLCEGEFQVVGDTRVTKVNVRVLAATHRDLRKMVLKGRFREDLFFRLNLFSVSMPPLRERLDDIPVLVEHLRGEIAESRGRPSASFSKEALERLKRHDWPGNVRELRNTVERALTFCDGAEVKGKDLRFDTTEGTLKSTPTKKISAASVAPPRAAPGSSPLREDLINALWEHHWVVRAVAAYYDVAEDRIFRWVREYQIRRPPSAHSDMASWEPFTPGRPILDPRRFFGRERALAEICQGLRTPMQNMLLQGPKRRGKTSLLMHLTQLPHFSNWRLREGQRAEWLREQEDYRFAYVDFYAPGMLTQERVMRHILSSFDLRLPERCAPDEFLGILQRDLCGNAVILFDNFERVRSKHSQLDGEFWAMMRSLTVPNQRADLAFIIATDAKSARELATHQGMDSPFFNTFSRVVRLPLLSPEEAGRLVRSSPTPFSEDDAAWIVERAGGCPNCLQVLCRLRYADMQEGFLGERWREDGDKEVESQACRPHEAGV